MPLNSKTVLRLIALIALAGLLAACGAERAVLETVPSPAEASPLESPLTTSPVQPSPTAPDLAPAEPPETKPPRLTPIPLPEETSPMEMV